MLRFILAVFVVFIHASGPEVDIARLHASGFSGMAAYDYLRIFISYVVARSAVPLFFIFSGYLLFRGVTRYDWVAYVGKLRKRWHSLVIPYIVWNVLYVLWILALMVGVVLLHDRPLSDIADYFVDKGWLHMLWDCSVWGERTTWLGTAVENNGPALLPFWYMRDLIVLVLLSPVVYWLVRRLRWVYLLLLLAVYLLDIRPSCCSATIVVASLFFSIGAYFSIMKQDFTDVLWKWRGVILPLAVALIVIQTATGSDQGDDVSKMVHLWQILFQTLALLIVSSYLCRFSSLYNRCSRLAAYSFFIYASHFFILGYVGKVVARITPMADAWYMQTIDYLLTPIVCVALCVAMYEAGMRWMPRVMKVATGQHLRQQKKG